MAEDEAGDAGAPRDRGAYLSKAYINAFGKYEEPDWDPQQGYVANRDRLIKVYDYYPDTYLKRPDQFLWAGLGRMAGGTVVGGLDLVVDGGETFLTKTMVRIGKAIFHDIAWQHEAFLDDPQTAIDNATAQDASSPARRLETTKHQNREVVLVDDGSEVPVTCQQPAVLLVRNEDPLGTSGARRHGAEIANRDVFVWLDAHMTFAPGWLDQMMVHVNSGSFLCSEVWDYEQSTCYCRGSDIIWRGERDYWSQCYPGFVPRHRTRFPGEARLKYQ